ncbi:phosphoserine phosphatase [Spirochaetia bacterium]|nr:phosphoserine phosphatase [Spirochaetia bacterium]
MVHLFDVDNTIIKNSTTYYFLLECLGAKAIRFRHIAALPFELIRYTFGFANQNFIEQAVTHLAGFEETTIDRLAQKAFDHRLKQNLYRDAEQLIRNLRVQGESVHLATSSFYSVIRPLEQYLELSDSITGHLEFVDGKTSGRVVGTVPFGENKKIVVQAWLADRNFHAGDVAFYSDSYTDISLLEICGRPVAVNPDRFLAKEAGKRGWEVLHFRDKNIIHE